jgi:hypothetical protein
MFEQPATMPVSVLDAAAAPTDVAAWATTAAPGAHVLTPLAAVDPARLDPAGRIDLLIAFERQAGWLAAAQQRVLATLDGVALDWAGKDSVDYTEEQVAAALRLSPGVAADRLAVGRTLVERLPATLKLLERGEITYLPARRLAEAVAGVDDPSSSATMSTPSPPATTAPAPGPTFAALPTARRWTPGASSPRMPDMSCCPRRGHWATVRPPSATTTSSAPQPADVR